MTIKTLKIFFTLTLLTAFAAIANAQSVNGSIGNGTVLRGSTTRATVYLNIPSGLHVNSNSPKGEYQIPTSLRVSGRGIKFGNVFYPRGRDRKFSFSSTTINVYEGRTAFSFPVIVPQNYRGSTITVRVSVKYQACTDETCFPPRSKEVTLTAKVR